MRRTSKAQKIINLLSMYKVISDKNLSIKSGLSIIQVQECIHYIQHNRNKFKRFGIIRHGKQKDYSRELTTSRSNNDDAMSRADYFYKKLFKNLGTAVKQEKINLETRESIEDRLKIKERILNNHLMCVKEIPEVLNR